MANGLCHCCSVLKCVAVCCSVLTWVDTDIGDGIKFLHHGCSVVAVYVAVCYNVLQCAVTWVDTHIGDSWGVAGCMSVLQCVAVCCKALQCIAVYCSVLQCVDMGEYRYRGWLGCGRGYECVTVCSTVLSVLQCVAVCVAVCCSVLWCAAV